MMFSMIERSDVNAEVGSSEYSSTPSRSLLGRPRLLSISALRGDAERMHCCILLLISEEEVGMLMSEFLEIQ